MFSNEHVGLRLEAESLANQQDRPLAASLAGTVKAMRPVLPAKDFPTSRRFYEELGFRPQVLAERLVEMQMGAFSFILQDYYVEDWANNFVIHLSVSDVNLWWDRIVALNLAERYRIKTSPPRPESWGIVVGIVDPSGVLWRIAGPPAPNSE